MDAQIERLPIASLKPWARNPRTHSKKQIGQIAASIQEFGFTNPVLIDDDRVILAGHGRVRAAESLGWSHVPCLRLSQLSPAQKRAYVLADNKIALNAGWDEEFLAQELQALLIDAPDLNLGITGFTAAEIDRVIEGLALVEDGDPREDREPAAIPPRCRMGDLWQLGPHRLLCGDARDPGVLDILMDGALARMVFTDPPYNVPIAGHVSGLGKARHREFLQASGEMSPTQFTEFLRTALVNLARVSMDGAIHFICMDWRHMGELTAAGSAVYSELKNLIVWVKDNGGMGTFYRSRHELIFIYKVGEAPHLNTFELGQHGRYRTNVWEYRGVNSFRSGRAEELALHPTVKPVHMIADAIKDVSRRGEIVLDVFGGSGSTLIAAHKTGRRGYLIELDPLYCDRILARWEAYAHDEAQRLVCGLSGAAPHDKAA